MAGVNDRRRAEKGGLLAFGKALAGGAGQAGDAAAPSAPPDLPAPPPAADLAAFEARIAKSLGRIAAAARAPGMQGDHYREVFIALAGVVELMPEFVREVRRGREPLSEETIATFLAGLESKVEERLDATVKRASGRWFRAFDRRTNLFVATAGAALFAFGCLLGFAAAVRLLWSG